MSLILVPGPSSWTPTPCACLSRTPTGPDRRPGHLSPLRGLRLAAQRYPSSPPSRPQPPVRPVLAVQGHLQGHTIQTGLLLRAGSGGRYRAGAARAAAWLSPTQAEEVRIHIQEAPRHVAGSTTLRSAQPAGRVIDYVPWGHTLRVTARHGEGVDAWLRGDMLSYMLANSNCRISCWIPATAIWTVADRELHDILASRRVFHG